ncbi:MAG: hypothetical protein FJ110_11505 [Deltaproteobacteria bacterium]|nr:hypothetical protein [Deltaproteobacteria bacterium]
MKRYVLFFLVSFLGWIVLASVSSAQHGHSHGAGSKMETREVSVEGVKIIFQIMSNAEHKKMLKDMKMKEDIEPGTTHNIALTLKDEKTQKEITNAEIQMKVIDPKGKDQIKTLKYEDHMKSYDAYFNLPAKGKYQVLVLYKSGEKKGTAGIYHEVK